jgi:shikimate kinase
VVQFLSYEIKFMKKHIILTGFMGSGKTTTGRVLAARLGWDFIDTDEVIVHRLGMPIPQVFAQYGEGYFRQVEAQVCAEVSERRAPAVIALGGGALLNPETRQLLEARGEIFCLVCDLDELMRRVQRGEGEAQNRPLFQAERARLEALLEARRPIYERYPQIDTTTSSPERVAEEILRQWNTLR